MNRRDDRPDFGRRQAGCGLIEQQKAGLQRYCHRDFKLTLMAVGEMSHLGIALIPKTNALQGIGGETLDLGIAIGWLEHREATVDEVNAAEPQMLYYGKSGKEIRDLEGAANTGASPFVRSKIGDRLPE